MIRLKVESIEFVRCAAGLFTYTAIDKKTGISSCCRISKEQATKLQEKGIVVVFEPGDVAAGRCSL